MQGPFKVLSNPVRIKADDRKPVEAGKLVSALSVKINGNDLDTKIERIIDSSGLKDRDNDSLTEHSEIAADMWLNKKIQPTDSIDFDFDEPQKLDLIKVWNYNQQWQTQKGVKKMDVKVWTESEGWKKVLNDIQIDEADGNNDYDEPSLIRLDSIEAAKVRFDDLENLGDTEHIGLSEVQFYAAAGPEAINPLPAHRSRDTAMCGLELQWKPGPGAVAHNLYLGTESDKLELLGKIENQNSAKLSKLASGTEYLWRIDEIQADGSVEKGDLWSFTTGQLVGWWKLDETEGDIAADSSGHEHAGQLMNEPNWISSGGKIGGALEFDGKDDYVEVDYAEDLSAWTLAVWVKSPASPSIDNPSGPVTREKNFQINWNHVNDTFRGAAGVCLKGQWYAASFGELKPDTWYHLAATYDGENFKSYKDGSLVSYNPAPSGKPDSETQKLKFGKNMSDQWFFKGLIDDVRIYNCALGKEDVSMIYSGRELSDAANVTLIE